MKNRRVPLPKPDPGARFKPGDFDDVLEHLPATCILIGGQAVAWWAEKYSVKTDGGNLVDNTSKDIEFWGRHEEPVPHCQPAQQDPISAEQARDDLLHWRHRGHCYCTESLASTRTSLMLWRFRRS